MKRLLKAALSGFFLICVALPKLSAQDWSWDKIMLEAEKNNLDLAAAAAQIESARAHGQGAQSGYLPQLSGAGGYSKSDTSENRSLDSYSVSLTAQQSLFSGFATQAGAEEGRLNVLRAELNFAKVESGVRYSLATGYINALYGQENVRLLQQIRDRKEANKRLIELRFLGGRENRGAFLRADAQLSQAQFEFEQANRALLLAQRNLAQVMGREDAAIGSVSGSWDVAVSSSLPDFKSLALTTPEYRDSLKALLVTRTGLLKAKSGFYPSWSVSATGRKQGDVFPPATDSWSLGTALTFPFLSGGSDFNAVRQAKADIAKAVFDLNSRRLSVAFALENAYISLQDAAAQSKIQKQFLSAAEERARIARAQYNNGLVSYQDWDLIESDLTSAQKQTLESLKRAVLAQAAWLNAQGKGLRALE